MPVKPLADHQKCSRHRDVTHNMWCHILRNCRSQFPLQAATEFASIVILLCFSWRCQFLATENITKTKNTPPKTYDKLSLFIFLTLKKSTFGIKRLQNSVFYEAFLPITWIKFRAWVTKYSKCMESHVMRDIEMPGIVRMVHLW